MYCTVYTVQFRLIFYYYIYLDRNQAPRANEAMQIVNNAYEVLSNTDRRIRYDREIGMDRNERIHERENHNNDAAAAANEGDHEFDQFPNNHEFWIRRNVNIY